MFGNTASGQTPGGFPIPNVPIRRAVQQFVPDLIDLIVGVANQQQGKNQIRAAFWQVLTQNGGVNEVYQGFVKSSLECFEYLVKQERMQPQQAANTTADKMNTYWAAAVLKHLPDLQRQLPQSALQAAEQSYNEYRQVMATLAQFTTQFPDGGGFGSSAPAGFHGGVRNAGGMGTSNGFGNQLTPVNTGLPGTGIKPMTALPGIQQSVFQTQQPTSVLDVAVGNTYQTQQEERRLLAQQQQEALAARPVGNTAFSVNAFAMETVTPVNSVTAVEVVKQEVEIVMVEERQEKKPTQGYADINDLFGKKQQSEITPREVKQQPNKEAVNVNNQNITYILPEVATPEQTPPPNPDMPWAPAYNSSRQVLLYAIQDGQAPKLNLIPKEDVSVDYKNHKIAHLLNPGHDHFPSHKRDLLKAEQQLDRITAAEELDSILSGFLGDDADPEATVDSSKIDIAVILDDALNVPEGMSPMAVLKAAMNNEENVQNLPKVPVVLRYRSEHALVLSGIASNAVNTINAASSLEAACRALDTTKDIIPRAQWNLINDRLTKATNFVYNVVMGFKRDIIEDFAVDAGALVKWVGERKGIKFAALLDSWTPWIVQSSLGLEEVDTDNVGSHLIYSSAGFAEPDHPPRTLGERNIVAFMPLDSRDLDLASMEKSATVVAFSTPKLFAALTTLFKLADDTVRNVSMIFEDGPTLLAHKVVVGETVQYVVTKG